MTAQNKKRAKLIDVARYAGVSPGTVSNALHNTRFVEPQTRRRIEEAIAALNYTPNIRARQLRTGKTNTIALLSSVPLTIASGASRLGFMMEVALTSAMMALEKQHALILVPPGANPLDAVSFDAAILIEPAENDPQLQTLAQAGIPCVTIGRTPGAGVPVPWVELHSAATAQLLLTHLETSGANKCALFVSNTRRTSVLESEATYQHWCEGRQQPVIYYLNESDGENAGYQAAHQLRQAHPDIDGVLVLIDTFASGAVRAFQEQAVAIPGQMRVVTRYDGIRARESLPPLTAVNMHLDEVARQAITLLFDVLAGKKVSHSDGIMPELVVRASTSR
ncbi:substrate-binding domain-containing protein [Salmonella bongori]|uniref:Putative lacI-family transcriptional regulator n=1 Tax=Salmonella bongori (strain ATCC 43975 / DSM 13772 / NCTC 12419) TaxID=218493 RepID=A0A0K0HFA5_SALBC|nr:LacI family DNA-binding transcriptional regulator [Salmonella bongori]EDP8562472.1 LacI family DNA-binding transcriptional regulator [Salmonella bongori]EJB3560057.1 substrate-binding domain-containing protein [Salmonella bongori]CCC32281.1 putative lacI-family transcriptional regulator [Salmonella bongori NCTC 12419]